MPMIAQDVEKATQALAYFADCAGGVIDKMKALKLIYFADRYHLRTYGRPVIGEPYKALPKGPVASKTLDLAQGTPYRGSISAEELCYLEEFIKPARGQIYVEKKREPDLRVFSETDRIALKFAFQTFGSFSGEELSELTHDYPEWKAFEAEFSRRRNSHAMDFLMFFENPTGRVSLFGKDPFETDPKRLDLIKGIFLEDQEANTALG